MSSKSKVAMPDSMEEWNQMVRQLFGCLHRLVGEKLNRYPIMLWNHADLIIEKQKAVSFEDYCTLYYNTVQAVRSVLPNARFSTPTVVNSLPGLNFMKRFLVFCRNHGCIPELACMAFVDRNLVKPLFSDHEILLCRNFVIELCAFVKENIVEEGFPIYLLEYYYAFGRSPVCDSAVGSMFPIRILLDYQQFFSSMGYLAATDHTTRYGRGRQQFCGTRGILSNRGGKKAMFYSFRYLSMLGPDCLGYGSGYFLTKKKDRLCILLYYDIPEEEWPENFNQENALDFYKCFQDMQIILEIHGMPEGQMAIYEEFLNYETGSAYENWLESGFHRFSERNGYIPDIMEPIFDSVPKTQIAIEDLAHSVLRLERILRPFELRYVEVVWK